MAILAKLYRWQYHGRQWYAGHAQRRRGCVGNPLVTGVSPRRVLIVLTGLIGDAVMSTPVIVEARRLWPDARIVMLGNRQTCALLSECPLIDDRFEAPAVPFSLRNRQNVGELQCWMNEQEFDVAIILLGDQFAQLLANAQIPERVGVRGHLLAPFLTKTYDICSPKDWGPPERLGALRALGHDVRNVHPQLWVSDHARSTARAKLVELGLPERVTYAAVHPFGRTLAQRWPQGRTGDLADALFREHKLWTIVVGGPEACGSIGPSSRNVIDSTGALSIPELMAVIDEARVVISTDSGPFHIAGALGRPVVGMFRARRPEHASRYHQADVVFGCHDACDTECRWDHCRKQPCRQMKALLTHDVVAAVRRTLICTESQVMNAVLESII
jgi:heptosyltransferase I